MRIKVYLSVVLIAGLMFSVMGCQSSSTSSSSGPMEFMLSDLSGKTVKLSDFRGKVIIIDFWATWCVPCREEIPNFSKLYNKFKNEKNFAMFAIVNESGDVESIKESIRQSGIDYPVIIGDMKTVRNFGVPGYPTTFVLSKEGKITLKIIGPQDDLYAAVAKEVTKQL